MKLLLIFSLLVTTGSAFAQTGLKFVVQQDLNVNTPLSQEHPEWGNYLQVRFEEDGTTVSEAKEPQCLLYIYTKGPAITIAAGSELRIKSSDIDHPQDTSQAIFHKDRGVHVMAETGSENLEFRVNCSDSAATYMGLKDFTLDVINAYVGQFVTIE